MRLKKDIPQLMNKKRYYGRAGDQVKIIGSVNVEKLDGSRFTVNAADLEENPPPAKEKKSNSKLSLF